MHCCQNRLLDTISDSSRNATHLFPISVVNISFSGLSTTSAFLSTCCTPITFHKTLAADFDCLIFTIDCLNIFTKDILTKATVKNLSYFTAKFFVLLLLRTGDNLVFFKTEICFSNVKSVISQQNDY